MTEDEHNEATALLGAAWSVMEEQRNDPARLEAARLARDFIAIIEGARPRPKPTQPPQARASSRAIVARNLKGVRYPSVTNAQWATGCKSANTIYDAIKKGYAVNGVFLRFEDTPEAQCPPMRSKRVCVRWKRRNYGSIREAAQSTLPEGKSLHAHEEHVRRLARRLNVTFVPVLQEAAR